MTPSVFVSVKQWDVKIIVTAGKGSNMTKMQDLDDFFWRTVGSLTVQDKHGTQGLPSQTKQKKQCQLLNRVHFYKFNYYFVLYVHTYLVKYLIQDTK